MFTFPGVALKGPMCEGEQKALNRMTFVPIVIAMCVTSKKASAYAVLCVPRTMQASPTIYSVQLWTCIEEDSQSVQQVSID